MVRLTQMKWNGTVSQVAKMNIPVRLARAKITQATSIQSRPRVGQVHRSGDFNPVTLAPNRPDRLTAEFCPEPPYIDVYDVRSRVEPVSPDFGQEALLAQCLSGCGHQLAKQEEFALSQRNPPQGAFDVPADQVKLEATCCQDCRPGAGISQPCVNPGQELFEREGLGEIVLRTELEGRNLGCRVGKGGEHDHRLIGPCLDQA